MPVAGPFSKTRNISMVIASSCSRSALSVESRRLLGALDDRGVAMIEGTLFISDVTMGTPPEGAVMPRVVMKPTEAPLTVAEQASTIAILRGDVIAAIAMHAADEPMSVALAQVHYHVEPAEGIDLTVELHGLVDRVAQVSLS
jgi:hypothetical protein